MSVADFRFEDLAGCLVTNAGKASLRRRSARPRKLRLSLPNFDLPQEKICQLVISERGKPVYKKTLAEHFVPSLIAAWL